MATEDTHLLRDGQDIYDRFSKRQKRVIQTIVSIAGPIPFFVSNSFVPSIPQVAKDFGISPAIISSAVSASIFACAFGGLVWSACSSFYGRRPMYMYGMPLMAIGSLGTSLSTNLPSLLSWRFLQTFGCSGAITVGPAVIGDIYRLEERGTALGEFFGATLFGLALAPTISGATAQYLSWRWFQLSIGLVGLSQMILAYLLLPETSHPNSRGIDKRTETSENKWGPWINPFSCLDVLRSPVLIVLTLENSFAIMTNIGLLIPMAYTVGVKYNITSEAVIGLCFLPSGIGNFVGSVYAGRLSDTMVKKWKNKRNGVWCPEDRLRAVYIGGLYLVPVSMSILALAVAYIDGTVGLTICLICLFVNGFGCDMVVAPIGAYTVDVLGGRSAEGTAAMNALRSLIFAPFSGGIIPSINLIGLLATNLIVSALAVIGYFLLWLLIRYGDRMRAYTDIGFAVQERKADVSDERA